MTIRAIHDDDVPRAAEVVCACYVYLAARDGWSDEQLARVIEQRGSASALRMQMGVYAFFVAVDDDDRGVVGVLAIDRDQVTKLYVEPAAHGRGVGTALFRFAEEQIADAGFDRAVLGTTGDALGFYQRMGMRVTGTKVAGGPLAGKTITLMAKDIAVADR